MTTGQLLVQSDLYDRRMFWEQCEPSAAVRTFAAKWQPRHGAALSLLQDLFSAFYKVDPHLVEVPVEPELRINHALLTGLLAQPEWRPVRAQTELRPKAALVVALDTAERLLGRLDEDPGTQESLRAAAQTGADRLGARHQRVLNEVAASAVAQAGRFSARLQEGLEGLGLAAAAERLDLDEYLKLARRLGETPLSAVGSLAARARRRLAATRGARVQAPAGEVLSVGYGRDLLHLLPVERARLAHPVLRADLVRRLQEGTAMQYRMGRREPDAPGALAVLLDTSSSTEELTPEGYRVRDWLTAAALGLLGVAEAQERLAAVVHFADTHTPLVTTLFRPGAPDPAAVLRVIDTWLGGDTDWSKALTMGQAVATRFGGGDLMLLTDGLYTGWPAGWVEKFQAARRRTGLRAHLVVVTPGEPGALPPQPPIFDTVRVLQCTADNLVDLVQAVGVTL